MMPIFPLLPKIQPAVLAKKRYDKVYTSVLETEAIMGGKLFGPIKPGHRREFFCLNPHTWVWHEEWLDNSNERHILTTYYHIRKNIILKSHGDQNYQSLTESELQNFLNATKIYIETIPNQITDRYIK